MKKKISLRWKLMQYLLIFAALLIGLIALFQLILLEPMYEKNKIDTVTRAADTIIESLDDDDFSEVMYQTSLENEVCIRVLSDEMSLAAGNMGCALYRINDQIINHYEDLARQNNNRYLEVDVNKAIQRHGNEFKEITLTALVEDESKQNVTVMVNTAITPIDATTQTLRTQIFYISILVAILVIILVLILNYRIATPLVRINEAAKELSEGQYHVDEKTNLYLEAQELNNTLDQAAHDIQKADQAKRDLIANVSHDLRTPLTMIGGYGEMMRDLPGEKTDENIQVIIDESMRLKNLVNDLLDLSKLQEKKIELHRTTFDIGSLLNREVKKYELYHDDKFIFELQCADGILVDGDEMRIEQVINNFITNAINYSGDSKRIIIRAIEKEDTVRIEVQDFGEGISEERLPYIWERYYKIDREHVRSSSGSGLGLAITKQILELHQVNFGVESKLNEGSTFWFELPLVKPETSQEQTNS